jgi:hypothetical protein
MQLESKHQALLKEV